MTNDEADRESRAVHRMRCAVSEATAELMTMGLYEVVRDPSGTLKPVKIDPTQRRKLLVYLSELEELMKVLDGFKLDLAQAIERASRSTEAVMTYQRAAMTLKDVARRQTH